MLTSNVGQTCNQDLRTKNQVYGCGVERKCFEIRATEKREKFILPEVDIVRGQLYGRAQDYCVGLRNRNARACVVKRKIISFPFDIKTVGLSADC